MNGAPCYITNQEGELVWRDDITLNGPYRMWQEGFNALPIHQQVDWRQMETLRYQGQYRDQESGLHYNTFRYFDPSLGRFSQPDPIGLAGGWNLYQYAPNPFSWVDPWGWACGRVHGNSHKSTKPNHVYMIRNKRTGEIYKYGISSGRVRLDSKSYRAEKQVRKLSLDTKTSDYESVIVRSNLTRAKALKVEQGLVNSYSKSAQTSGLTRASVSGGFRPAMGPTGPEGNIKPTPTM